MPCLETLTPVKSGPDREIFAKKTGRSFTVSRDYLHNWFSITLQVNLQFKVEVFDRKRSRGVMWRVGGGEQGQF